MNWDIWFEHSQKAIEKEMERIEKNFSKHPLVQRENRSSRFSEAVLHLILRSVWKAERDAAFHMLKETEYQLQDFRREMLRDYSP